MSADMNVDENLSFEDLEFFYEALAQTIDETPESRRLILLSKLALALAHRCSSRQSVLAALAEAQPLADQQA